MADHINIREPWSRDSRWSHIRDVKRLEAELEVANMERDQLRSDLDAIFTRIKRGDPVELHYPDGSKIVAIAMLANQGGPDA